MKRAFAVITVMVMIFGITAFAGGTVIRAAAYDDDDRIALWQENKEVPYDGRYWIQPNEWNCSKIDSRDYEGGIMIFFDKIGLYPEYANGKVQRVYVSVVGAQEPVSMMKFHIFYDKRLKIKKNSKDQVITAGRGVEKFTTGSSMVKEGELAFYSYSNNDIKLDDSCLFMIDFIVPEDAKPGDIYPIGMSYIDDGIVCDLFINSAKDFAGKIQMTYVFTKGIYNGYIKILDHGEYPVYDESSSIAESSSKKDSSVNESRAGTSSKTESKSGESSKPQSKPDDKSSSVAESSSKKDSSVNESRAGTSSKTESKSGESSKPQSKPDDKSSKAESDKKIIKGYANCDKNINVTDIAMIAAHIKGIRALTGNGWYAAEVSGDNRLDVTDIAMIAAHIKGIRALR